jgi:hypothetical protein
MATKHRDDKQREQFDAWLNELPAPRRSTGAAREARLAQLRAHAALAGGEVVTP